MDRGYVVGFSFVFCFFFFPFAFLFQFPIVLFDLLGYVVGVYHNSKFVLSFYFFFRYLVLSFVFFLFSVVCVVYFGQVTEQSSPSEFPLPGLPVF